jgi:glycogen phosphorylase
VCVCVCVLVLLQLIENYLGWVGWGDSTDHVDGPADRLIHIASIPEPQREAWRKHQSKGFTDRDGFEKEIVHHVETSLGRSLYNCDEGAAYSATALAFRDRLITEWSKSQQRQTYVDSKRVYYLSLEFLMGRALDNAMLNVGMKDVAKGQSVVVMI